MKATYILFLLWTLSIPVLAQNHTVYLAGGSGNESFNDVIQLSNGQFLVAGTADDLQWLPIGVSLVPLTAPSIANNQGTAKIGFLLLLDSTARLPIAVYYLAANAVEGFTFIKTTNIPRQATGDIYISGPTEDSNNGGYFIGKLNNNFIAGAPTGFEWVESVKAKAGNYPKEYQPWDVGSDGKVVYATGDSHDYNWSAIYRLKADGSDDVVPNWRVHWTTTGEYYGSASNYPGGLGNVLYSGIVLKRDGNRCELRSHTLADYNQWLPDGNGGSKKGRWPLDVLYNSPCTPGATNTTSGPGYTGYSPPGTFTYGPQAICIDRRSNDLYIGINFKSVLPGGLPDFEPAVLAMNSDGDLLWWNRLYHEVTPAGDTTNSTPDQYVDALAIDYSQPLPASVLVVNARCHGNNVENLWEGNTIAANPAATGFQNQFTGSSGNIHISWLGKLNSLSGTLLHSTYVAEYAEGASGLGTPHPDPNLDGWPNPNTGWPTVNTTYLGKNKMKVTANGSVLVLGKGRRTITTADAYQKMVKPGNGRLSCWNDFVRLYDNSLTVPMYSSLLVGQWDTLTQLGGDNVKLYGAFKTEKGVVVVGKHLNQGNALPLTNEPQWAAPAFLGEQAMLAYHQTPSLFNPDDSNTALSTAATQPGSMDVVISPNPAFDYLTITSLQGLQAPISIVDLSGRRCLLTNNTIQANKITIDLHGLAPGTYFIKIGDWPIHPFVKL